MRTQAGYVVAPKVTLAFSSIKIAFALNEIEGSLEVLKIAEGTFDFKIIGPASMDARFTFLPRFSAAAVSCNSVAPIPRDGKRFSKRVYDLMRAGSCILSSIMSCVFVSFVGTGLPSGVRVSPASGASSGMPESTDSSESRIASGRASDVVLRSFVTEVRRVGGAASALSDLSSGSVYTILGTSTMPSGTWNSVPAT